MTAFVKIVTVLLAHRVLPDDAASRLLTRVAGALLKQALERIGRVRERAAASLLSLIKAQVCPRACRRVAR